MITAAWIESVCLDFEGVTEHPHFDKKAFKFKNGIFATLDSKREKLSIKLSEIDQSVFCDFQPEKIYRANGAWGKQGWTIFAFDALKAAMLIDALTLGYVMISQNKNKLS